MKKTRIRKFSTETGGVNYLSEIVDLKRFFKCLFILKIKPLLESGWWFPVCLSNNIEICKKSLK
jgi:hypothetical protein